MRPPNGELVISISQRRNVITLYRGTMRYILQDVGVLLTKANQALSTLEKYKSVLEQALTNLSALEFEDLATLTDVTICLQRAQMVSRVAREIERYVAELGVEGRLVSMQLDELMVGIENQGLMIVKDYASLNRATRPRRSWPISNVVLGRAPGLGLIARSPGFGGGGATLDVPVTPRGYRIFTRSRGCLRP